MSHLLFRPVFVLMLLAGPWNAVQFSLSEETTISGRVLDAVTAEPLPGDSWPDTWLVLYRVCGVDCKEFVRGTSANAEGRFSFVIDSGIPPGTYLIEASANLYPKEIFGPFEFIGANLDVGDLTLDPLPTIRSIEARVQDKVTRKPIPQIFRPFSVLYRCQEGSCDEVVSYRDADHEGRVRFETDSQGHPLPVGTYQVLTSADQYHYEASEPFEVMEGGSVNVGTLRTSSYPLRFSDFVPCEAVPASGGECAYSLRVWNGLPGAFKGDIWSLADTYLPHSKMGSTFFQVKDTQELVLGRGKSKVVHFLLKIPSYAASPENSVCLHALAGRGGNSFFNTVAYAPLFCLLPTPNGYTIAPLPEASTPAQAPEEITAKVIEVEPNNSCQAAQDMGALTLPFSLDGFLSSPKPPDVDFYRFRGTPGAVIAMDLAGQLEKGTLQEPMLGVFDSECNLIDYNHDDGNQHTRVAIRIPADGIFITAASSFADWHFRGEGFDGGTYQLTVTRFAANGTISGRAIDAFSGEPLPGHEFPYALVSLLRCDELSCRYVNTRYPGRDGRFYFVSDNDGNPLGAGNYKVTIGAYQYEYIETGQLTVSQNENVHLGNIALTPFPVIFSELQTCSVPLQGGVCEFSMKVTSHRDTRFSGKAWSMIDAIGTGSFLGSTFFQTNTLNIRLEPGASRTLRFHFRVGSNVPDDAYICSQSFVGENPEPFFKPAGRGFFFCFEKGPAGFRLLSSQEAQALILQMEMRRLLPRQTFTQKK